MNYHLEEHRARIAASEPLLNAYSPVSLRLLISHILKGGNYRLITERNTKEKLFLHYIWIYDVYNSARAEFDDNWQTGLLEDLHGIRRKSKEQKDLYWWLLGITNKTATNLDIKTTADEVLIETRDYFETLFTGLNKNNNSDMYWLMLLCGAATLTIRGSDKSKVGKQVERILVKSMLNILGFTLNANYWLNIQRDAEVGRETDAEVQTRRGRIRIEVGLISSGNQEVIEDKIARVGQNGIILFDKIGAKSNIRPTAALANVNLIQIRDSSPLVELHRVLSPLVAIPLNAPPNSEAEIDLAVQGIPDDLFRINMDEINEEIIEEIEREENEG